MREQRYKPKGKEQKCLHDKYHNQPDQEEGDSHGNDGI